MQRDDPRDRSWRGRDEDLELWGRDMEQDDWMRGTHGPGGTPRRGGEHTPSNPYGYARRAWGSEWNRGPDWNRGSDWDRGPNFNRGSNWTAGWDRQPAWQRRGWEVPGEQAFEPEPWRGDRDWSQEWWRQGGQRDYAFGWTGSPWNTGSRQWHGRTSARGYQRSDDRIREDVYERLMEHPYVDTTDIEVSVSHGEVTLQGMVPDRWEKRLAEDLAEGVRGVTDVHNRLRAGSTAQGERGGTFSTPTGGGSSSPSGQTTGGFGQTAGAQPPRPGHEAPRPMPTSSPGMGTAPSPTQTGGGWSSTSGSTTSAAIAPGGGSAARPAHLREGMQVVGLDGEQVGRVKEIRGEEFLIDRPMARDLFAPMRSIQNMLNDQVVLSIPARQVDSMGWRSPEVLGAPPTRS